MVEEEPEIPDVPAQAAETFIKRWKDVEVVFILVYKSCFVLFLNCTFVLFIIILIYSYKLHLVRANWKFQLINMQVSLSSYNYNHIILLGVLASFLLLIGIILWTLLSFTQQTEHAVIYTY